MENETYNSLIEECSAVVQAKMQEIQESALPYHNWQHAQRVFRFVSEIAENTPEIQEKEKEALQLAALFHDVSYTLDQIADHEQRSADFAEEVLKEKTSDVELIQLVKRLVLATRMEHTPTDLPEQCIRDADLGHLKTGKYIQNSFLKLYEEFYTFKGFSLQDWASESVQFFEAHHYFTEFARVNYAEGKQSNLLKLKEIAESGTLPEIPKKAAPKKKKKGKSGKQDDGFTIGRGVETLFRVQLRNHINLSQLADSKANTLISVNAIIISIVLSALFPSLSGNGTFTIPALVLIGVSIITIVLAMLSTIPRTTQGLMTREDIINKKGNLTFFGNFHKMDIEDFEWGIEELIKDKDYLYKSLTRDLYHLGRVLNKKYIFLRIAYVVFVAGLIVTIFAFILNTHPHFS